MSFGAAWAQVPGAATDAVRQAFQNLASERSIRLQLTGSEQFGSSPQMTIADELYWWMNYDANGNQIAKAEFNAFHDGIQVQRAVGNGKSFYNFTPQRNEYWVTSYGTYGPVPPQRYLPNLVDDFTAAMKGSTTYLARLLREVYVVNGFRAWIPGGQEFLATKADGVQPDPVISTRSYTPDDLTEYAMFWTGNKKSIVFELKLNGASGKTLNRIFFAERSTLNGTPNVSFTVDDERLGDLRNLKGFLKRVIRVDIHRVGEVVCFAKLADLARSFGGNRQDL
jgi:hypothetical protein